MSSLTDCQWEDVLIYVSGHRLAGTHATDPHIAAHRPLAVRHTPHTTSQTLLIVNGWRLLLCFLQLVYAIA
jgi:hypothetical protein